MPHDSDTLRSWRFNLNRAYRFIELGDLDSARKHARRVARFARDINETDYLKKTGKLLLVLSDWHAHAAIMSRVERMGQPDGPPEWDGAALPRGTLVITERGGEHIARPVRFGHLIPLAARRVQKCIVLAEPRLVPLFRRSFPNIDIRALGADDAAAFSGATAAAGYQTLINVLLPDDDGAVRDNFRPLVPDVMLVRELRERYAGRPLIGISWSSTNSKKDAPTVTDWAQFMRSVDATFVSLQYGDVTEDIGKFRTHGVEVTHDKSIDPLRDMDGHAAQIAAMDAVVTISNTTAHMAGALGARTFVAVDVSQKVNLIWPLTGDCVPWFPRLTIARKDGRNWDVVLAEIRARLEKYIAGGAAA